MLGSPRSILAHAIAALEMDDMDVFHVAPVVTSRPIGPSRRFYANSAALISTALDPESLLHRLQSIEAHFGRQRRGQRWQARPLDLDIILWSGGMWIGNDPQLSIPHRAMRERRFVLGPAAAIAPEWREPVTGLTLQHLFHRFKRGKPLDRFPNQH